MKNIVLSVGAVLVVLGLAEIFLRAADIARPFELPSKPAHPEIFVADDAIGYRLWPSMQTCMRYPPETPNVQHLVSNSDGLRNWRELGEADPRPRIMVLGDSFTFGTGVEEGARFTDVVENLEPRWRVDNIGMPGWGLDLMVRALERFGSKAKPRVVVLAMYTEDFRRVDPWYAGVGFAYRKFAVRDGVLVNVAFPTRNFWSRLRLVELTRMALGRHDRDHFDLNERLVERFRDLTTRLGATPVILFLPGRKDTPTDRDRRTRLRGWAESRGIAFQDLTEPIHSLGVDKAFLSDNWHWSESGHRIAGEVVHEFLSSHVMPKDAVPNPAPRMPPWRKPEWQWCR